MPMTHESPTPPAGTPHLPRQVTFTTQADQLPPPASLPTVILAVALVVLCATLWIVGLVWLGYEGESETEPEVITLTTDTGTTVNPLRG